MVTRAFSIIDAPSNLGLRHTGVEKLPGALRAAGLLAGFPDVRYLGSVPVPPRAASPGSSTAALNLESLRKFSLTLADRLAAPLGDSRFCVVLGGDCGILPGCMLALRRRGRSGLIFIDGHADFYSPESEPNGEVASMPLAIVTGREPAALADLDRLRPLVRDPDVVVFGFRDGDDAVDHGSPDVRATGITCFDLPAVRSLGPTAAMRRAVTALEGSNVDGFWIHLDADVLDDEVMPAVDYRMPDGLQPAELVSALAVALSSPYVVGMDVTIYNPDLDDPAHSAAHVLARTISSALAVAT